MIIKFVANITLDLKEKPPENESEWETFNINLEKIIELALENNDTFHIETAEVIMEEK